MGRKQAAGTIDQKGNPGEKSKKCGRIHITLLSVQKARKNYSQTNLKERRS